MDVTRKNFKELLPDIQEAIRTSVFVSFDGEFTGLMDSGSVNSFDYPWEYYCKVKNGGMNFLLVQFGLCTFHYDKLNDRYTHKAFNFYVFPYSNERHTFDTSFLCQSSCMAFLAENDFNFNKLFREGIPYLNFLGEQKLRENFQQQQKARELRQSEKSPRGNERNIPVPEKYASFIKDTCDKVRAFMKSSEKRLEIGDKCNSFIRKLIFDAVEKNFNEEGLFVESGIKEGGGRSDRVVILTKEEGSREEILERREKAWRKAMLEELDAAIGFSSVIRAITESKKLVVGHNMLLDVCHSIHQFCANLPEDYNEFKELVHCVFPRLIDTKLMSNMYPLKDKILSTNLMQLLERLSEEPFKLPIVDHPDNFPGYSVKQVKSHEAGFDAYVTGICFIAMANYLGTLGNELTNSHLLSDSPLIKPFENKLYLMRVQDIPYMDLMGKDALPPRDHVFHLTFPSTWNTQSLKLLFGPFGQVYVSWLNDTSAYVALEDRDKASLVCKTLGSKKEAVSGDTFKIVPFMERWKEINRKSPCTLSASIHKDKDRDSLSPQVPCRGKSNAYQEASPAHSIIRKRKRSLGESSFAKRSIDPIPEEMEEEVDKSCPVKEMHDDQEESNGQEEDKCEDSEETNNSNPAVPPHPRAKRTKRKEFDEDESWD